MKDKVIIIQDYCLGIFDLNNIEIKKESLANENLEYDAELKHNFVIDSKNITKKIEKIINRRIKYEHRSRR